jgi:hypothetical protein
METNHLENRIRDLKEIKPRADWAILTKNQILNQEMVASSKPAIFAFNFRMVAPLLITSLIIVLTIFTSEAKILFTDTNSKTLLTAFNRKDSDFYLNIAEKQVKELEQLALNNETDKLPAAIASSKESLKQAANNLPAVPESADQAQKVLDQAKKIVAIGKNVEQIIGQPVITDEKKVLAVKVAQFVENGIESNQNRLAETVSEQINSVNVESLTADQKIEFQKIQDKYQEFIKTEDYSILNQIAEDIYLLQK